MNEHSSAQKTAYEISVVIPVYNGGMTVPLVVERLEALNVAGGIEVILVNDGSADNSAEVCRKIAKDAKIAVTFVDLARNYGEHNAVMAGLRNALGKYVVTIDDDLQHDPEEIIVLYEKCRDEQKDVIYAQWDEKKHSPFRNFGSALTNRMANFLLEKPSDLYLSTFRCMNRFLVTSILSYEGPYPYVDGLILQSTDRIGRHHITHRDRVFNESNYTLRRLLRLWITVAANFSVIPLRISTIAGIVLCALGMLYSVNVFVKFFIMDFPQGWASVMSALLVFSGAQLLMLGVIGEYVGRIHLTNNKRPQYVVRSVSRGNDGDAKASADEKNQ